MFGKCKSYQHHYRENNRVDLTSNILERIKETCSNKVTRVLRKQKTFTLKEQLKREKKRKKELPVIKTSQTEAFFFFLPENFKVALGSKQYQLYKRSSVSWCRDNFNELQRMGKVKLPGDKI